MYENLKDRISELLSRPRPIKRQTERQLSLHLEDHGVDVATFLREAAQLLEEHELDILFAPQFTPALEDKVAVSDLLYRWRPGAEELATLVEDLCATLTHASIELPGEPAAKLTLHEVMVERFVRLLHLDRAPEPTVAASMRDSLPSELWTVATALMRERGFTPQRQSWFAGFVNHMAGRHSVTAELLEAAAIFIGGEPSVDREALLNAAGSLLRASEGSVAYAQGGRAYWSADVAQHHQYRGEGQIDTDLVRLREEEVERLKLIESDLRTFEA
jgi:hypothetical protein